MNKGFNEGFWSSQMHRDGCTVTSYQMASAWRHWGGGSYRALISAISREGPDYLGKYQGGVGRVADGMLQHAKKGGAVEFDKRLQSWVLIETGE